MDKIQILAENHPYFEALINTDPLKVFSGAVAMAVDALHKGKHNRGALSSVLAADEEPGEPGPIPVAASALEAGAFNADPGFLILELDGLILGPNERYEFPASITVGVIPEPSTALLAALFPLFAFWRRTRG